MGRVGGNTGDAGDGTMQIELRTGASQAGQVETEQQSNKSLDQTIKRDIKSLKAMKVTGGSFVIDSNR